MAGDCVSAPAHKFEYGDELCIEREDVDAIVAQGFYFEVVEYDSEYARVVIGPHADADKLEASDDE